MRRVPSFPTPDPAAFLAKFASHLIILFSPNPRSDLVSSYRVNLGEYQLSYPSQCRISSPVSQIFVHPKYNSTRKSADIALLQLKESVQYTNEILPVCLPGPSDSFPDNHMCWVTGWGRIDSEGKTIPQEEVLYYHSTPEALCSWSPVIPAASCNNPCPALCRPLPAGYPRSAVSLTAIYGATDPLGSVGNLLLSIQMVPGSILCRGNPPRGRAAQTGFYGWVSVQVW